MYVIQLFMCLYVSLFVYPLVYLYVMFTIWKFYIHNMPIICICRHMFIQFGSWPSLSPWTNPLNCDSAVLVDSHCSQPRAHTHTHTHTHTLPQILCWKCCSRSTPWSCSSRRCALSPTTKWVPPPCTRGRLAHLPADDGVGGLSCRQASSNLRFGVIVFREWNCISYLLFCFIVYFCSILSAFWQWTCLLTHCRCMGYAC